MNDKERQIIGEQARPVVRGMEANTRKRIRRCKSFGRIMDWPHPHRVKMTCRSDMKAGDEIYLAKGSLISFCEVVGFRCYCTELKAGDCF